MMERTEVANWLVGRMRLDGEAGTKAEEPAEQVEAKEGEEDEGEEEVERELFKMKLEEDGTVKISPIDEHKP